MKRRISTRPPVSPEYPVEWRRVIPRILLAVFSVAVTLFVIEIVYRGVLWSGITARLATPTFRVMSTSIYGFDEEFGYRYEPGRTATTCEIVNGLPSRSVTVTVNRTGGIGPVPAANSPVKILAIGDSFTANPLQPSAWPEFLSEAPEFDVLNYGRDGYGLLQMMHLAAVKAREVKPDLVIVAIITEDLLRDRFWRSTVVEDGRSSIFVSTLPEERPNRKTSAELAIVDDAVTPEWLASLPAGAPETDPVFRRLCERFRETTRSFYLSRILDPTHCLLLNNLRFHDPYHGLYPPARNPRTTLESYADDPAFVADVKSITVPMALVLLPRCDEIKAGRYFHDGQSAALLRSLQPLMGAPAVALLDYMDRSSDPEKLFLLPNDQHPSPAGAKAYADAILRMLRERVKIRTRRS